MDKIHVVLDTNILVSALKGRGAPHVVVRNVLLGKWIPVYNDLLFDEYRDVLSRDYLKLPQDIAQAILETIERLGEEVQPLPLEPDTPDPDDWVFYGTLKAIDQPAYLISGNLKHYPEDENVLSPREFIDRFLLEEGKRR